MNKRRLLRLNKILLVCILLWPFVAWAGARFLITEAPLDKADAIVILSGSASYQERSSAAVQLFSEGRSQRILITNDNMRGPWSSVEQRNPFFNERALQVVKDGGVPAENVELLMQPVDGTHDEAELIRRYAVEHELHSILIVTSAYHSRRALWTFSRVFQDTGVQVGLAPVRLGADTPPAATWWLTTRGWKWVPVEYVKLIYYVIKYR